MQGKGGFLRILEAFIAIAIIAGVMSFLYVSQIQGPNQEDSVNQLIRIVLEKIGSERDLRNYVLNAGSVTPEEIEALEFLEGEIDNLIPPSGELSYHFSICELDEICDCGSGVGGGYEYSEDSNCPLEGDIFSDEISVSVTLEQEVIDPKVIRLFVWEN